MKNTTILATENATVKDNAMLFAYVLNEKIDNYNIVVDSTLENASSMRDDYLHVYRHNTTCVSNKAHNNVFQCYLKHKKQCVNVLCNRTNFNDFITNIQCSVSYKKSLIRYIVSYDDFIAFMREIIAYDNARATTSATKENAQQIAK